MLLNDSPLNAAPVNADVSVYSKAFFPTKDDGVLLFSTLASREWILNYADLKLLSDSITATVIPGGGGSTIYTRSLDNLLVLTDAQIRAVYRTRFGNEALSLTDALVTLRLRQRTHGDAMVLADVQLHTTLRQKLNADTLVLTDGVVKSVLFVRYGDNVLVVTDTTGTFRNLLALKSDALLVTDDTIKAIISSGTTYTRNMLEAMLLNDAALRALLAARLTTDGLTLLDQVSKFLLRNRTLSDGMALTDTAALTRLKSIYATDVLVLADARDKQLWKYVTDTLALLDNLIKVTTGSGTTYTRTLDNTIVTSDNILAYYMLARLVADGLVFTRTRTNLLKWSQAFETAGTWPATNVSIATTAAVTAPDGSTSARIITCTSATGRAQQVITTTGLMASIYVLRGTGTFFTLQTGPNAADTCYFNLATGTVASQGANVPFATITPDVNGWYRLAVGRGAVAGGSVYIGFMSAGSPGDFHYIWNAQLEAEPAPTAPILTTTAAVSVTEGTDNVVKTALRGRYLSDAFAAVTDSRDAPRLVGRVQTDTLLEIDTLARQLFRNLTRSDTLVLADAALRSMLLRRTLTELFGITDDSAAQFLPYVVADVRVRLGVDLPARLGVEPFIVLGTDYPPIQLGVYN